MQDITPHLQQLRNARRDLSALPDTTVDAVLRTLADLIDTATDAILSANVQDLAHMPQDDPKYDRLLLTQARLAGMADDVRRIADMPAPVGHILSEKILPNGLRLQKKSVPLGVVGVIFEARPNVTIDVFTLCFKAGNAVALKGGKEADHSNRALTALIHQALAAYGIDSRVAYLLPPDRTATAALLDAVGFVDVCIPRGSQALIDFVRQNAKIPVIETGAGIVHTYFDVSGDTAKGSRIIHNAKTRRVSVCNALDTLVIHKARLGDLPALCTALAAHAVEIFADTEAFAALDGHYPAALLHKAQAEDFGREFLDYKMSVKTVGSADDAITHIQKHSSQHSEAIIADDAATIADFLNRVDAAAVYANASTAFTDGGQFGMGAEIGISTQKLHARGPMGLEALTSYKWIIHGDGQTRT